MLSTQHVHVHAHICNVASDAGQSGMPRITRNASYNMA